VAEGRGKFEVYNPVRAGDQVAEKGCTLVSAITRWTALAAIVLAYGVQRAQADNMPAPAWAQQPPQDTNELLVFLAPGEDVDGFARQRGLTVKHALKSDANAFVLSSASTEAARQTRDAVRGSGRVRAVFINQRTRYVKMAFVPNDPYFHRDTPSAGWPGQWHLVNEWTAGRDARLQGAWNRDLTGSGVIIGIVDDCLETAHPDLVANYETADSWDFGQGDSNPSPFYASDMHGISTAGVAAARGGNGIGVTGAAPYARLAGLRIDFEYQTTQMFVDATLYHSSGANTNIKVKNHSYGYGFPYLSSSAEVSALATSTAAGTIHCFAAGNEGDDCNTRDLQKNPDSITVTAMGSNGKYADYTNFGACVMVTAPSSSAAYYGVTTTDRVGSGGYNGSSDSFPNSDYTSVFGGTSSAAPLVAGVMALGKQVQPALNARFAKHLLALTSDIVDAGDASAQSGGGWVANAAGRHFNANYGFGLIDADEFTSTAAQYGGVSSLTTASSATINVNTSIPDNNTTGVSRTFTLADTTPLEEVLVAFRATHSRRGDLEAWLTSPSGTSGRVFKVDPGDTGSNLDWTYTCNQFWGEIPAGTWTLTVKDLVPGTAGTWNQFQVTVRMGHLTGGSGPPTILLHPIKVIVSSGETASFAITAAGAQPLSYQWRRNGVDLADDGRITGVDTGMLEIANCTSGDEGSYDCLVTNSVGSATSNAATLSVRPLPDGCLGNGSFENGFTSGLANNWIKFNVAGAVTCASSTDARTGTYSQQVQSVNSSNTGGAYQQVGVVPGQPYTFSVWVKTSNSSVMEGYLGVDPAGGTDWNSVPTQYTDFTSSTTWSPQTVTVTPTGDRVTVFLYARSTKSNSGGYAYFDDSAPDCSIVAPTITEQPVGQNVCPGGTAVFEVSATGEAPLTYLWQKNGVDLAEGGHYSGTGTSALTVSDADSNDAANYRCVVSNAYDSATSNAASLALLAATTITQHPAAETLCGQGTAIFSVVAEGTGTLSYQWQKGGIDLIDEGRLLGATTSMLTIYSTQVDDTGDYRCVVTGGCGTAMSNAATLTVEALVAPDLNGDCDVDSGDLSVFRSCLSGPGVAPGAGCYTSDFDADRDVDQADFGILQGCLSGSSVGPDPNCAG